MVDKTEKIVDMSVRGGQSTRDELRYVGFGLNTQTDEDLQEYRGSASVCGNSMNNRPNSMNKQLKAMNN
ncbi:hypothetical protein EBO34_11790 [Alteribacter keqinensis]|uniref:Uncharacterized protein n=1 Tax=Alteribacter keqinensis TaxID=2483800 RepID=A0A3M7TP54_9BACI|nr:hypothetical protein EBO34_11790 [Alteribacter keqinensis]